MLSSPLMGSIMEAVDSEDDIEQISDSRIRDANEVGCDGLLEGIAVQRETGRIVYAHTARKADGPFYCGVCYEDVVHRYCREVRHHFAHKSRLTPMAGHGESGLHLECKQAIFNDLKVKFPDTLWRCDDVVIPADRKRKICALRPDIGGRIAGRHVVIEIQTSPLSLQRIIKRSLAYAARKVSILWIVALREDLGEAQFRPRLFERYLHSIFFGRTYYWYPGLASTVLPVHYGLAYRHIPERSWYEDGELKEGGGFHVPYKRIRRPNAQPPISISECFQHYQRGEHVPWNESKTVPGMRILLDKLPVWWASSEQEVLNKYYPALIED